MNLYSVYINIYCINQCEIVSRIIKVMNNKNQNCAFQKILYFKNTRKFVFVFTTHLSVDKLIFTLYENAQNHIKEVCVCLYVCAYAHHLT